MSMLTYKMRGITSLRKIGLTAFKSPGGFFNFVPQRGVRFNLDLNWVRPQKLPLNDPKATGDLATMPSYSKDLLKLEFQNSEELKTASERVKKLFSFVYQNDKNITKLYELELINKIKSHPLDNASKETKVAKLTAQIRYLQSRFDNMKNKRRILFNLKLLFERRRKFLKEIRKCDYKKFEWLLEKLDLVYKPVPLENTKVTRKKSLLLLAKLRAAEEKEKKLGEYKKVLDKQKVPFLKKKLEKLKYIQQTEKQFNLSPTVTDEDIQECTERIKKVELEIAEKMEMDYVRTIHPYFIEPYSEEILRKKEEKLRLSKEHKKLEEKSIKV